MIWWDWTSKQRWAFLGVLLAVGTLPGLLLALLADFSDIAPEWQLVPLSGLIPFIPLVLGWYLFVGLRTGRIPSLPATQGSDDRATSPFSFWFQAALYVIMIGYFVNLFYNVITYSPPPGS